MDALNALSNFLWKVFLLAALFESELLYNVARVGLIETLLDAIGRKALAASAQVAKKHRKVFEVYVILVFGSEIFAQSS